MIKMRLKIGVGNELETDRIKTLIVNDNARVIFIRTVSRSRADISSSTKCVTNAVTVLLMLCLIYG